MEADLEYFLKGTSRIGNLAGMGGVPDMEGRSASFHQLFRDRIIEEKVEKNGILKKVSSANDIPLEITQEFRNWFAERWESVELVSVLEREEMIDFSSTLNSGNPGTQQEGETTVK